MTNAEHRRLPLVEVVPLLAGLLSVPLPAERYPALTLTPQQQKQQTLDAVVAWLEAEVERQPVLVAWEDLHWADPTTLAERTLRKNGYLDPLFFFEGTRDYETREFPHLPKKALLDSLEALGFIFAYTDQIGDLVQIFFLCQASVWETSLMGVQPGEERAVFANDSCTVL